MHGFGQSLSTGFLFTVISLISIVLSLLMVSENSQQQSANSIVQTALLDASNNNAKAVDGTLVVDTKKFEQNLQQSSIDNWRKRTRKKGAQAEMAIGVYYLDDKSKNANDFHKLEAPKNPANKAIRGVKVVVMRLIKTSPKEALKKLAADQKSVNKQLGVANSAKQPITKTELEQLSNNETVYLVQPTDIITYLVSGHGTLRNDDVANGVPQVKPDKNNRNNNAKDYLISYVKPDENKAAKKG